MKMTDMFPSNYIKGDDVKGKKVTLVIADGKLEEMNDGGHKPVLYFKKTDKGLVLNRTNGDTIAEAYGEDSDHWIGKPITLYFDPKVSFAGKRTGGIRVEIPNGAVREELPPIPDEDETPAPF